MEPDSEDIVWDPTGPVKWSGMELFVFHDKVTVGSDCDDRSECGYRAPELTVEEVDALIAELQAARVVAMAWRASKAGVPQS